MSSASPTATISPFPAFDSHSETRLDTWRNTVVWISVASSTQSFVIPMGHLNGDYIESKYPLKDSGKIREAKGLPLRPSDYSTLTANEVKMSTPAPAQLSRTQVFKAPKLLLLDPSILKVGHNLSFDLGSVAKYIGGIPVGSNADTMIAGFLIDSSKEYGFGRKDVAKQYADIDMVKVVGGEPSKRSPCRPQSARRMWMLSVLSLLVARWVTRAVESAGEPGPVSADRHLHAVEVANVTPLLTGMRGIVLRDANHSYPATGNPTTRVPAPTDATESRYLACPQLWILGRHPMPDASHAAYQMSRQWSSAVWPVSRHCAQRHPLPVSP